MIGYWQLQHSHVTCCFFSSFIDCSKGEASEDSIREKKYIVFESCLMALFENCKVCLEPCSLKTSTQGTCVTVTATCPKCHVFKWSSQPFLQRKPLGNLLICSGILFSGSCPTKVLRLLSQIGICTVSESTYYEVQEAYLWPAISSVSIVNSVYQ